MSVIDIKDIEFAFLGFLLDEPKHGYDLFKEISDPIGIGQVYRVKIGNMYAILKKLEIQKLITSEQKKVGNRPQKTIYSLTEKGKVKFQEWMETPILHGRDFRILFLLKMYFINRGGSYDGNKLIIKQEQECQCWEDNILKILKELSSKNSYQRIVLQYRLSQIRAYKKWLDWCIGEINEKNAF